jgi:hypothetical protein
MGMALPLSHYASTASPRSTETIMSNLRLVVARVHEMYGMYGYCDEFIRRGRVQRYRPMCASEYIPAPIRHQRTRQASLCVTRRDARGSSRVKRQWHSYRMRR